VEHVDEHPVLGEHVIFAAPEVQAVDADPFTRGRAIQVPAGMRGQHAIPAGAASVSALGEQAVQILYSPIGEGVQPVFLVQVLEFRQVIAGADSTRPVPLDIRWKVVRHTHALQVFLVENIQAVENEAPDQVQCSRGFDRILSFQINRIIVPRCWPDVIFTPCRGQHLDSRLLHQVNDVQESEYFVDPAILHLAKFAPADMDILAGGRDGQPVSRESAADRLWQASCLATLIYSALFLTLWFVEAKRIYPIDPGLFDRAAYIQMSVGHVIVIFVQVA